MVLQQDSGLDPEIEKIAEDIVDAIWEVVQILGHGLLERCYALALAEELRRRGHLVEYEVARSLDYKGTTIGNAYKIDLWVDRKVIVECKTVSELRPEHYAQLNTYLRFTGCRLGFLANFAASPLRAGIKRVIR